MRLISLMAFMLLGCIAGEDGKDGRDGRDLQRSVYDGVLYAADQKTGATGTSPYWDIPTYSVTDSSLVNVYVRQGSGYMWQVPTWYVSTSGSYVRIVDDEKVAAAYEYHIIISR